VGPVETRGASVNGTQVNSIRLPGYVIGVEVIFGMLVGVYRGLDSVLEL
jgi:hypothetical protein